MSKLPCHVASCFCYDYHMRGLAKLPALHSRDAAPKRFTPACYSTQPTPPRRAGPRPRATHESVPGGVERLESQTLSENSLGGRGGMVELR